MADQHDKVGQDPDLMAIRSLLQDQEAVPEQAVPGPERRHTATRQHRPPEAETRPQAPDTAEMGSGTAVRALPRVLMDRVRGYRPTRRHVALAILAMLALLRPWLLVALIVLPLAVLAGVFATLGSERVWAGVLRGYKRYHARSPARAERLRRRADAFALRWDGFLDRFPEGLADALALPDLTALQESEARHEKALDRRFDRLQSDARMQ